MSEEPEDAARRLVEASAWRVHLAEIDAESSVDFEQWLASDPLNAEAWSRVEAPWKFLGAHATEPEVLAARSGALGIAPRFGRPRIARALPWRAIAATALCLAAAGWFGLDWLLRPLDYQTALGERRSLVLADGSRLTLDSNSEVRVSYSNGVRNLALVRGQARFEVAHDASRPFLVAANGATVRATGTDFDVDLSSGSVVVTLIQGRVEVTDTHDRVPLVAGQQLTLVPGRSPLVASADTADILAWQNGQVVFHDMPLADAVARMNRYDQAQIELGDRRLADLRVSGTFNAGDAVSFADIVARYLKVRAVFTDAGRIKLQP